MLQGALAEQLNQNAAAPAEGMPKCLGFDTSGTYAARQCGRKIVIHTLSGRNRLV